jgi:hypothetical protein
MYIVKTDDISHRNTEKIQKAGYLREVTKKDAYFSAK